MHNVGIVPVVELDSNSGRDSRLEPQVLSTPRLRALAGRLVDVSTAALGAPIAEIDSDQLARVEDVLCGVLHLPRLCGDPPIVPRDSAPPSFPQWSEIYRVIGQEYLGEAKRWVVVSDNQWQGAQRMAIVVRTTTSKRRHGPEFPLIQSGQAKAVCGNATTFPVGTFRMQPRDRPEPGGLDVKDMIAIAHGLIETNGLGPALMRALSPPTS